MKTPQRAQTQKFTIYLGRNNPFFVVLKWFGVALTAEEMAEITRVDLMYKDVVISSTLYPTLIDFTTHADESRVYFDLAGLDLEVGEDESCEIIVFTDEYADGVVHQPILHLTVTDEALGDAALIDPLLNISLDDLQDVDTSGGAAGYVLTQQADDTFAMGALPAESDPIFTQWLSDTPPAYPDEIPSIVGLLDETSHDLLDHTGLTGVPDVSGYGDIVTYDAADFAPAMGDDDNYVTDAEKANLHAPGSDNQDLSGYLLKSTYDANSILAATTDDTPAAVTVAEQSIIGRIAGGSIDDIGLLAANKFLHVFKDFYDPTSATPSTPATGDRYIASATANGWTINRIYTYNGSSWLEITPENGYFALSIDRYGFYKYLDSKWQHANFTMSALGTQSSAGTTKYFNAHQYDAYSITIAATTTLAPTGTYTSGIPYRVWFFITNGGAATVSYGSSIKHPGGTPPTLTTSGLDLVAFTTINGGTSWQMSVVGKDFK